MESDHLLIIQIYLRDFAINKFLLWIRYTQHKVLDRILLSLMFEELDEDLFKARIGSVNVESFSSPPPTDNHIDT